MRRVVPAIVALLSLSLSIGAQADHVMVLVASRDSSFDSLSILQIRKTYLGFDVIENNKPVIAAINRSSEREWRLFLQNVIGMSERSYDRRLLTLTLQVGRSRPAEFDELDALLDFVAENPNHIAFVWEEDLEGRDDLEVVRILWHH
jgi:hypothetical protein